METEYDKAFINPAGQKNKEPKNDRAPAHLHRLTEDEYQAITGLVEGLQAEVDILTDRISTADILIDEFGDNIVRQFVGVADRLDALDLPSNEAQRHTGAPAQNHMFDTKPTQYWRDKVEVRLFQEEETLPQNLTLYDVMKAISRQNTISKQRDNLQELRHAEIMGKLVSLGEGMELIAFNQKQYSKQAHNKGDDILAMIGGLCNRRR